MAEGADAEEKGTEECGGDDEGGGKANKINQQKKKEDGDAGKKKASSAPLVLGVDLHCDGCARKVVKAIKAAQGVEGVAADVAAGTVTVSGKDVDPWDLKDRIESRTHRPVAFVSPPNPAKKKKGDAAADEGKKCPANDGKGAKAAGDDKKKNNNKEGPESTVVVKMGLHCNGCIDRIRRTAHKIKGVREVKVDTAKEQVTVQGTMDAKALPDVLSRKLRRDVALVVPAKSKDGSAKKQQKQEGGEGADNKVAGEEQPQQGGGGKNNNKKKKQGGEEAGETAVVEEQAFPMAMMYGGGGWTTSYRVEMLHAPQLFSDENPNACAVM